MGGRICLNVIHKSLFMKNQRMKQILIIKLINIFVIAYINRLVRDIVLSEHKATRVTCYLR